MIKKKIRKFLALLTSISRKGPKTCSNISLETRGHLVSEPAEECGLRKKSNKQFNSDFFGM